MNECLTYLETFPCTNGPDEFLHLAALVEGVSSHLLPMVEDRLREGLSSGVGAQLSVEAEGLGNGEVSLDSEHRGSWALLFTEDLATTLVQATVDTANSVFWALNLD